jgi:hypothetical protein
MGMKFFICDESDQFIASFGPSLVNTILATTNLLSLVTESVIENWRSCL